MAHIIKTEDNNIWVGFDDYADFKTFIHDCLYNYSHIENQVINNIISQLFSSVFDYKNFKLTDYLENESHKKDLTYILNDLSFHYFNSIISSFLVRVIRTDFRKTKDITIELEEWNNKNRNMAQKNIIIFSNDFRIDYIRKEDINKTILVESGFQHKTEIKL